MHTRACTATPQHRLRRALLHGRTPTHYRLPLESPYFGGLEADFDRHICARSGVPTVDEFIAGDSDLGGVRSSCEYSLTFFFHLLQS